MKISIIMIKAFIFSCILKKRQHCLDYGISKERILSDGGVKFGKVNEDQASIYKLNKESINLKLPEAKKVKICPQETMLMTENNLYPNTKEFDKEENLTTKEKDFLFIDESKGNITSPLKKLENFCTSINMKILFANIEQYMSLHLFGHQFEFYKSKLVNINEIYNFLNENELKLRSYQSIFVPYDNKINEIFFNICSNHDYDTQFVPSSYDIFVSKLISGIFNDKELRELLIQVGNFSHDDKKVIFYSEFFNCVKYCVIFPELMSLRSFNYQNSMDIITIFVRFINLYLAKNNNAGVIRFFILCVLKKAFNSSYKTSVDFFSIQKLQTDCTKYNYNLNFFLWELSKNKRRDIKQKLNKHDILNFSKSDKIHFKIVLLTFIYQQIICFKYFLVNYEIYEHYYGLIDIIIKTDNCPICDFNKFFELLKKQDQI